MYCRVPMARHTKLFLFFLIYANPVISIRGARGTKQLPDRHSLWGCPFGWPGRKYASLSEDEHIFEPRQPMVLGEVTLRHASKTTFRNRNEGQCKRERKWKRCESCGSAYTGEIPWNDGGKRKVYWFIDSRLCNSFVTRSLGVFFDLISASLALVRGIHRSPVNSPYKGPVTWRLFPFDDVIIFLWHPQMT